MPDLPSNAPDKRFEELVRDLRRRVDALEQKSDMPTSGMIWWPGSVTTLPSGWVPAAATVSRDQFRGILTIVGTDYGAGNQQTTFDLPEGPPGDPAGGLWIVRA